MAANFSSSERGVSPGARTRKRAAQDELARAGQDQQNAQKVAGLLSQARGELLAGRLRVAGVGGGAVLLAGGELDQIGRAHV
jgi:hypothetical protein